jgi:hypothetical protein
MQDDDEILEAYEQAVSGPAAPPIRHRRHGFGLVVGAILTASVVLIVAIFANRSIGNDIGRAEHDLRAAQSAALGIHGQTGSYSQANADGLSSTGGLTFVDANTSSTRPGQISIYATDTVWAAAVLARPGACFYLKLDASKSITRYGAGTTCTGVAALSADGGEW